MIDLYPIALIVTTGLLWFFTWLTAHRLLWSFCERHPSIARQEIPHAFNRAFAHPEKALYFFRPKTAEALRHDPPLFRLRQRVIFLTILSAVVPLLGFLGLGAVALFGTFK